jgi:MFS family permease
MSFTSEKAFAKVNVANLDNSNTVTELNSTAELQQVIQNNTNKQERALTVLAITMCVLGAVFYCYEYYLRVAPSVMAAELKSSFHLTDAAFGNLFACYYYAYTPMQIPVGMMLDKFGPRRVLTFACFLCVAGTYLFSNTDILEFAQLGRFIVGFGSAFAYVGVLKISDIWLPKKYFALMVGVATALGMIGAMTGELTMAYMVGTMGWQATLIWSVIAGIILTVLLGIILKDSKGSPKVHTQAVHSSLAPGQDQKILKGLIKIIKTPQMWINGIIGCLTFLPITVFAELWAVPYLETLGFSKADAALGSSMVFLGFAVGGPCWGFVSDALQSRKLPLIGGSFLSAVLLYACIILPNPTSFSIYCLLFLCSFAASAQVLVFAIGNDITASSVTATAVAFTNMLVMLGGAILPQVIGKILDFTLVLNAKEGLAEGLVLATEDYSKALIIIPIGLVLAGLLSLCLKESYKKSGNFN